MIWYWRGGQHAGCRARRGRRGGREGIAGSFGSYLVESGRFRSGPRAGSVVGAPWALGAGWVIGKVVLM